MKDERGTPVVGIFYQLDVEVKTAGQPTRKNKLNCSMPIVNRISRVLIL